MWDDFSLYVNPDGNLILLKILRGDESDTAPGWLNITINQDEVLYDNQSVSVPDLESIISIPLGLLNKIGLIDSESFMDFTQRKGVFSNRYNGNIHSHYYLYTRERQNEVFLLQHKIPAPSFNTGQLKHQEILGEDFSNIPLEEHIQRYGISFRVTENRVIEERGMIYVPWKYELKNILLYPLLAASLTTVETIQKLGGEYIFGKEESLD
jgi:hypothetical protein